MVTERLERSFGDWHSEMMEIYDKFRRLSKEVPEKGLENSIPNNTSGYLICFRLPEPARFTLSNLSLNISKKAPAMVYVPEMLHVTLSDFVQPTPEFFYDESIMNRTKEIIEQNIKGRTLPENKLENVLYNSNSVVVEGYPDYNFYDLVMDINDQCEREGIELRKPWGAHSTVSRFTGNSNPKNFLEFIENYPALNQKIKLSELVTGYFEWKDDDLHWNILGRFYIGD